MNELPPEASAFLVRAGTAHDPPDGAADRVRRRVAAVVAAGAASALAQPAAASARHLTRLETLGLTGAKIKVGLACAVLAVAAGAFYELRPHPQPAAAGARPRPALVAVVPLQPVAPRVAEAVAGESSPVEAQPTGPSERAVQRPKPAPKPAEPDLQAEMTLLARAKSALDHGELSSARASLRAYRARFPAGQLREERRSLELLAKCLAGERVESVQTGASNPSGVLSARIARACAERSSP